MNKQVKKEVKKNKRRIAAWWWSIGAVLTLSTLVTCTIALPATSFTSSSTSTSLASSSVNNQITLIGVEVSKNPTKIAYSPVDVISTSGGELRLIFSDNSSKIVAMSDTMIDQGRLKLSSIGSTNVFLNYTYENKLYSTSYQIDVIDYKVTLNKLSIDISNSTIVVGEILQLNLNLEPFNADLRFTTWESSNNDVVSVDQNGIVSANNEGIAVVTVYSNGLLATSRFTVVKNPQQNLRTPRRVTDLGEYIPISNIMELDQIRLETESFTASYNNVTYTFDAYEVTEGPNLNALKRKYILVNNIDFQDYQYEENADEEEILAGWDPIGDNINPFIGELNGNNKRVENLVVNRGGESYVGLFGFVESISLDNPIIYDLTIDEPFIFGNEYVGALTGYLRNGLVENISVTTEYNYSLEELISLNEDFNAGIDFEIGSSVFINPGIVVGTTRVGGIVGRNINGIVSEVVNYATIASEGFFGGDRGGFVGGIVGGSTLDDPELRAEILDATNYGLILAYERDFVGGIVGGSGLFFQPFNENLKVLNSTNYGDIVTFDFNQTTDDTEEPYTYYNDSSETNRGIGGIAGANGGIISNVVNYGQIGVNELDADVLVFQYVDPSVPIDMIQDLDFEYREFNGTSVGGIAGFNFLGAVINNSINRNDVYGTEFVGGIAGNNSGVIYLSRTVNELNIENIKKVSGFDLVGGLVGLDLNFMDGETIDNSTNDFEVIGLSGVGGIVGSGLGSNLFRVANFANVSGAYDVGGIAGRGDSLTLREGYNSGNIGIVDESYLIYSVEEVSIENLGGLFGAVDESYIETSFNAGDVSGPINVGGLIGLAYDNIKLIESINIGSVILDNDDPDILSVGNLIGNLLYGSDASIDDIVANLSLANDILAIGSDTSSDFVNGFSIKELTSESDLALLSTYSFTLDNPALDYNYKWNIDDTSYQVWEIDDQSDTPLMPKWLLAPPTERFIYPNYQYLLSFVKGIEEADDFSNNTDTFDINLVKDISDNITSIDYVITITDDQEFSIYSESTDDAIFRNNDIQYIMLERANFAAASGSPKLYALNDSHYELYLDNDVIHADAVLIEKSTTLDYGDFAIQISSDSNDFSIFVIPSNTPKAAYVIRLEPDSELTSTEYANIAPYAETIHIAVRNFVPFFHD
jgi:hypothetical protein